MLPYLKSSLDFHRLQLQRYSSCAEKVAKQPAELINKPATQAQKPGPLLALGGQRHLRRSSLESASLHKNEM